MLTANNNKKHKEISETIKMNEKGRKGGKKYNKFIQANICCRNSIKYVKIKVVHMSSYISLI